MRDCIDLFFSAFDMHLSVGKCPVQALILAAGDYAAIYHSEDDRSELSHAAERALCALQEAPPENDMEFCPLCRTCTDKEGNRK